MFREFLVYLYCAFTGKDTQFSYQLPYDADWDEIVGTFKTTEWKASSKSDEIFITVEPEQISIHEFYASGFIERGSGMLYSNEVSSTILPKGEELFIEITVSRVAPYHTMVIINCLLLLLFLSIITYGLYARYAALENVYINFPVIIIFPVMLLFVLITVWFESRLKHQEVFKKIQSIINKV